MTPDFPVPCPQGMEVHFTPDVEAQLHALVTETGRAADAFVQDAMGDENETCKIPDSPGFSGKILDI